MTQFELRICGRYIVEKEIFSNKKFTIIQAFNNFSNQQLAIKIEKIQTQFPCLLYEAKILQHLQGSKGIPFLHWCGQEADYNIICMELLDQNLSQLLQKCGGKFTLKTVLMIGLQILFNIEFLHFKGYLHRNIKADNFMIGRQEKLSQIYLISFSLAKRYKDLKTLMHIPEKMKKPFLGNSLFASINSHLGLEQSRRDDLESIVYLLIFFLNGSLPWSECKISNKNKEVKQNQIFQLKQKYVVEYKSLCKSIPEEFQIILDYVRSLDFEETPNYNYIRKHHFARDGIFDWMLLSLKNEKPKTTMSLIPLQIHNPELLELAQKILNQFEKNQENELIDEEQARIHQQYMLERKMEQENQKKDNENLQNMSELYNPNRNKFKEKNQNQQKQQVSKQKNCSIF